MSTLYIRRTRHVVASPWPIADALVVLPNPMQIVASNHDAYEHPYFKERSYSLLMAGPPGSGDIGGIVVHPAQGAKTLTILLSPGPDAGKRAA